MILNIVCWLLAMVNEESAHLYLPELPLLLAVTISISLVLVPLLITSVLPIIHPFPLFLLHWWQKIIYFDSLPCKERPSRSPPFLSLNFASPFTLILARLKKMPSVPQLQLSFYALLLFSPSKLKNQWTLMYIILTVNMVHSRFPQMSDDSLLLIVLE